MGLKKVTELPRKGPASAFGQRHYTVKELAVMWHVSPPTIRALAEQEEGVIRFGTPRLLPGKKRTSVHLRIPESVAARIYDRLTRAS